MKTIGIDVNTLESWLMALHFSTLHMHFIQSGPSIIVKLKRVFHHAVSASTLNCAPARSSSSVVAIFVPVCSMLMLCAQCLVSIAMVVCCYDSDNSTTHRPYVIPDK